METKEDVERLEKVIGQLNGLYEEISLLGKKTPNDSPNAFKLGLINKVIKSANLVLGEKYKPFEGFDEFDSEDVPSNSDVTLVIKQYMEEVERFRSDNVQQITGYWYYVVNEETNEIRSAQPTRIGRK